MSRYLHLVHFVGSLADAHKHVHVSSWPHGLHGGQVQKCLDPDSFLFGLNNRSSSLAYGMFRKLHYKYFQSRLKGEFGF